MARQTRDQNLFSEFQDGRISVNINLELESFAWDKIDGKNGEGVVKLRF